MTISYGGLIAFLSSQPYLGPILPFPQSDKLFHAVEFGILSYLLYQALYNLPFSLSPKNIALLVLCLTLIYAILDEYHQSFVPGRQTNPWDVVADVSGVILVQWIILKRL